MIELNHLDEALNKVPQKVMHFEICDPALAQIKPLEFVIENMAAKGLITVIAGSAGSGKSFIMQYLLQTRSNDILKVNQGKAFYLTGADASDNEIRLRAHKIKDAGYGGLHTIKVIDDNLNPMVSDRDFINSLITTLKENQTDAVVFDTLRDYYDGDSSQTEIANKAMSVFKNIAENANVAVILITHTRKSATTRNELSIEDVADSRIFTTKADFVFGLQSEYKDDESSLIQVVNLKTRSSRPLKKFRYRVYDYHNQVKFERTDELFEWENNQKNKQKVRQKRDEEIIKQRKEGVPVTEIAKKYNLSRAAIYTIINSNS